DKLVTGVQTCALPISPDRPMSPSFHPAVSSPHEKSARPVSAPHSPILRLVFQSHTFPDSRPRQGSLLPQLANRIQLPYFRARLQSSRLIMEADPISFVARWPAFPDRQIGN